MSKWAKWRFWLSILKRVEKRCFNAWMDGGNCTSCCKVCKQWEHTGNSISTADLDDGSVRRVCSNCGHAWVAIFTPAGFLEVGHD